MPSKPSRLNKLDFSLYRNLVYVQANTRSHPVANDVDGNAFATECRRPSTSAQHAIRRFVERPARSGRVPDHPFDLVELP